MRDGRDEMVFVVVGISMRPKCNLFTMIILILGALHRINIIRDCLDDDLYIHFLSLYGLLLHRL